MRKIENFSLKLLFSLFLLLSLNFAFAAKKQKESVPEWVTSPGTVYPSDKFINYVGSSTDRNAAEVNALKGLASVFGQAIKSESNSSARMEQAKTDGIVAKTTNVQTFSQDVKRVVDVDNLIGAETKAFWLDSANSTWYAIAVLDKSKASDIYSEMIKKNSIALSTLKKNSEKELHSLEGFAAYDFAEEIAVENENHLKKMAIINPDAVSGLEQYCPSSKNIHAKKMEIAKNIPICVKTSNDEHGRFKEAFSQAISECGFKGTFDDSARYVLTAKFEFERSDTSDKKTVRCRYNAESYILDKENNHQLVPFTISGRESHVEYSEAKVKAEKKLESKIKTEFKQKFSDYLRNLVVE